MTWLCPKSVGPTANRNDHCRQFFGVQGSDAQVAMLPLAKVPTCEVRPGSSEPSWWILAWVHENLDSTVKYVRLQQRSLVLPLQVR